MDFAVCPSCGQSVLDDDAVECPFCGASMKGGGAKPAATSKSAATATAAGSAAAKAPAQKPAKAKSSSGGDDLPFGLQEAVAQAVVKAAPKPMKGRTYQVVCPMCETAGYIPSAAAGKEVKCANAQCLVPVFTAPLPKEEPPPPPPKKSSGNLVVLGVGTALVVGAIGGAVRYFATLPSGDGVFVKPVDIANIPRGNSFDTPVDQPTNPQEPDAKDQPTVAAPGDNRAQLIAEALEQSRQVPLRNDRNNRSKPFCRRFAAEAFALAGDIEGARAQFAPLKQVGAQVPFYQITPWVEVFWQERAKGNQAAATAAVDSALAVVDSLPVRGSDQLDTAMRLGQALVVAGRAEVARDLIKKHQSAELDGEFSAILQWLATDRTGLNITWLFEQRPIVPRNAPQAAAVTAGLVLRGERQAALDFALGWTDPLVQTDCLSAWAEAVAWTDPDGAVAALTAIPWKLPELNQAYVWARAARVAHARQAAAVSAALSQQAAALLEEVKPPANYKVPTTKSLAQTRPTWNAQWVMAARAAAELCAVQQVGAQDTPAAVKSLERALSYTRGLGPSVPSSSALTDAANRAGPSGLRDRLKAELELRTDDDARLAMGEYRRALTDLEQAAKLRFDLQVAILQRAAWLGLEDAVWRIVAAGHTSEDPATQEPLLNSRVANWLAERFQSTGNSRDLQQMTAARSTAGMPALVRPHELAVREQLAAGNLAEAWKLATDPAVSQPERESWILRGIIEQALKDAPLDATWKLVSPLSDVSLREQGVEWTAWMAARRGAGTAAWSHHKSLISATEIMALSRGLIAGLQDRNVIDPPVAADAGE